MKKSFSLKDSLFNKDRVVYLGCLFEAVDPSFNTDLFVAGVMERLLKLELKERIVWIAEVLERHLPSDFKKASVLIIAALPEPLDPSQTDNDFGSFIFAPLGEYVVRNGLQEKYLEVSFATLCALTQRFSMEDAMRSFLNTFEEQTLAIYASWVEHPHYHVRRLVSESTRPLLPWSKRIGLNATTPIVFLDVLHTDATRFVTRSVANHLNDIAKKNPKLVVQTLARWKKEARQDSHELAWITRHALRTLVKKGDVGALTLLGYKTDVSITVRQCTIASKDIVRGDALSFTCHIRAQEDVLLLVDYVIDFVKANEKIKPKVFKIKKVSLKKGESIIISKQHIFNPTATTFSLYAGMHAVGLQINGKQYPKVSFRVR